MNIKYESVISLPNGGTEYYGENWFAGNIKIAQSMWRGTEPYSRTLWPRYFSEIKRYGNAWFRFRNSHDMVFEILLDGTLDYTQNGISETVHPGEIYIIHSGSDTVFTAGKKSYFHRLRLSLCGNLVRSVDRELDLVHRRILRPTNLEYFGEEFRRIGALLREHDAAKAPQLSADAYRIMAELAENSKRTDPLPERLEQLIGEMKSGLSSNFSIQEFAVSQKIEVHTLMRLFRRYLNTSPHEYLTSLRMVEASHLVGGTELPMKEIAEMLGYANSLYFSSVFHRHFGMSPKQYRKSSGISNRE